MAAHFTCVGRFLDCLITQMKKNTVSIQVHYLVVIIIYFHKRVIVGWLIEKHAEDEAGREQEEFWVDLLWRIWLKSEKQRKRGRNNVAILFSPIVSLWLIDII